MGKHTVPRMYLRSFSIDGKRQWIYQKLHNEEPKAIPIAIAAIGNVYTDETEERLRSLEGESDGLLKQIIVEGSIDGITADGKRILSEFMHTMQLRTWRHLGEVSEYNQSEDTKQKLASDFVEIDYQNNTNGALYGLAKYVRDNAIETKRLNRIHRHSCSTP